MGEQAGPVDRLSPAVRWWMVGGAVAALCSLPMAVAGREFEMWAERAMDAMTGPGGVCALAVSLLALDTVLPVPSSIVATVASQQLGFAGGTVVVAVGLCTGNAVGYLIGRTLAADVVERLLGPAELARARAMATTRPGSAALALTRPVPILSEAVMVLAGSARTPVARTAAVCGLANLGLAMAYAAAGGGAGLPVAVAGSVGIPAVGLAAAAVVARRRQTRIRGLA